MSTSNAITSNPDAWISTWWRPGASDSMWFRVRGVPSYGVAPIFIKDSDDFSHGLNERTQLSNIVPGVAYWKVLIRRLSS